MSEAAPGLSAEQLGAYFALDGDLSYVQFQLLARLVDAPGGRLRMTDLADGVVYSRSGLTYQAGLLDKRGLITRSPSPDDERSVMVAVTDAGRDLVARVLPGHVDRVRHRIGMGLPSGSTSRRLYNSTRPVVAAFITGAEYVIDGGLLLGPALRKEAA